LTKFWLTKPKTFTWLNTLEKIKITRDISKIHKSYSKKTTTFISKKHLKTRFHTNKQKQVLAQISRLKKKNKIVYLKLFSLLQDKKSHTLRKSIKKLIKICNKNKSDIQKMNKAYQFLLFLNKQSQKKISAYKPSAHRTFTRLKQKKLIVFYELLKKKLNFFSITKTLMKKLFFIGDFHSKLFINANEIQKITEYKHKIYLANAHEKIILKTKVYQKLYKLTKKSLIRKNWFPKRISMFFFFKLKKQRKKIKFGAKFRLKSFSKYLFFQKKKIRSQ